MAEQSLMDKVSALGVPKPTSAIGASQLGATPQEAAMAGTQAAKKAVIKKEQTLRGAERATEGAQMQAPELAQAAAEKSKQIAEVGGSLSSRVQGAIQNQLATVSSSQQLAPQVNSTALGSALGLSGTVEAQRNDPKYKKAADLVLQFANSDVNARDFFGNKVQDNIIKSLEGLGIPAASVSSILSASMQAVGKQATAPVANPLTVAELDLKGLVPGIDTIDQLATTLGIDKASLSQMAVDKLPSVIQDVQQRELAASEAIRAQMAGLTPDSAQYQILNKQLQSLQTSGAISAEAKVTKTIQDLNVADEIEIGGAKYSAKELFEDDKLSELITNWLMAPKESRDTLIDSKKYGPLTQWLTANEESLGDLINKTEGQVTASQASIEGAKSAEYLDSPIGRLETAGRQDVSSALANAPAEVQTLAPADMISAYDSAVALTDPNLAALAGVAASNGFVVSPQDRAKIMEAQKTLELLRSSNKLQWITDPNYMKLSNQDKATLAQNPARYDSLVRFYANQEVVRPLLTATPNSKTFNNILHAITGTTQTNRSDLENQYATASKWAAVGDPEAVKHKKWLEQTFFFDKDHKALGAFQAEKLQAQLKKQSSLSDKDIISGKADSKALDYLSSVSNKILAPGYSPAADSLFTRFSKPLSDGKLSEKEIKKEIDAGNTDDLRELIKSLPNGKEYTKVLNNLIAKGVDSTSADIVNRTLDAVTQGEVTLASWQDKIKNLSFEDWEDPKYKDQAKVIKKELERAANLDPKLKSFVSNLITKMDEKETLYKQQDAAGNWASSVFGAWGTVQEKTPKGAVSVNKARNN